MSWAPPPPPRRARRCRSARWRASAWGVEEPGHHGVQLVVGGHLDRSGHQVGRDLGHLGALRGANTSAAAAASSVSAKSAGSNAGGSASSAFSTISHRVPASSVVPARNALVWAPVSVTAPGPERPGLRGIGRRERHGQAALAIDRVRETVQGDHGVVREPHARHVRQRDVHRGRGQPGDVGGGGLALARHDHRELLRIRHGDRFAALADHRQHRRRRPRDLEGHRLLRPGAVDAPSFEPAAGASSPPLRTTMNATSARTTTIASRPGRCGGGARPVGPHATAEREHPRDVGAHR